MLILPCLRPVWGGTTYLYAVCTEQGHSHPPSSFGGGKVALPACTTVCLTRGRDIPHRGRHAVDPHRSLRLPRFLLRIPHGLRQTEIATAGGLEGRQVMTVNGISVPIFNRKGWWTRG